MQSNDYVPGVSGWKIDPSSGEFELHSDRVGVRGKDSDAVYSGKSRDGKPTPVVFMSGELPQTPQPVTLTAAEWAEWDMPANALERYKFIGDAVMQIPSEYRASAEFSTEDHSYDRDGSDIRTTLTYSRPETPEEASARVERAKVAGTKISITNNGVTIVRDGVVRVRLGDLSKPFAADGDQVFISETAVDDGVVLNAKLNPAWSLKMTLNQKGQYVASGVGSELEFGAALSMFDPVGFAIKKAKPKTPFEQALAEGDAAKILDMIVGNASETDLVQGMKEQDEQFANRIRKVMADEIRPGGMLYRFSR